MPGFTIKLPNGKHLKIEDAEDENGALAVAQDWWAQNGEQSKPKFADTSYAGALGHGLANVVHGVGSTVKNYINKDTGKAIEDVAAEAPNVHYASASEQFTHPEDDPANHIGGLDWSKLPRAAIEQAPGLLLDIIGQKLTKGRGSLAKQVAAQATYGIRSLGDEADKRAQARTGDPHAEPTTADKTIAAASTALQGGLAKIGASSVIGPKKVAATGLRGAGQAVRNVAQTAATEGLVSAGQDAISQGMANVGTDKAYDPKQTLGAGVLGAVGGGVFAAPHAVKETVTAARYQGTAPDEHTAAAANRITQHAGGDTASLKDPKEAYHATSRAVADVRREIGDIAQGIDNPTRDLASTLDAAKKGHPLHEGDLAVIDAHGDAQLSSLARQSNALNTLVSKGNFDHQGGRFAGGAHDLARQHAVKAIGGAAGVSALAHMVGKGAIGLDSLFAAAPHAAGGVAGAYGLYLGARALDRGLGLASPARTFAEKFGDGSGVPTFAPRAGPSGPSVPPSPAPIQPWGSVNQHTPQQRQRMQQQAQTQAQRQMVMEAMPMIQQLYHGVRERQRAQEQAQKDQQRAHQDAFKQAASLVSGLSRVPRAGPVSSVADAQRLHDEHSAATQAAALRPAIDRMNLAAESGPVSNIADAPWHRAEYEAQQAAQRQMEEALKSAQPMVRDRQSVADMRRKQEAEQDGRTQAQHEAAAKSLENALKSARKLTSSVEWASNLRSEHEASQPGSQQQVSATLKSAQPMIRAMQSVADMRARHEGVASQSGNHETKPKQDGASATEAPFELPESPHAHLSPVEASHVILEEAMKRKNVRHPELYRQSTERRLRAEEDAFFRIHGEMGQQHEMAAYKYLPALWGSDSPSVVVKVRNAMLKEFPKHKEVIMKHLPDSLIHSLWSGKK